MCVLKTSGMFALIMVTDLQLVCDWSWISTAAGTLLSGKIHHTSWLGCWGKKDSTTLNRAMTSFTNLVTRLLLKHLSLDNSYTALTALPFV